ncbi:hypothetical protein [Sphingopyxis sp.]|uniref:hypothetical protein n=1 Tax=Sphingopyxis sp. TaxID=1908224 RepID=UPI0035AE5FF3
MGKIESRSAAEATSPRLRANNFRRSSIILAILGKLRNFTRDLHYPQIIVTPDLIVGPAW